MTKYAGTNMKNAGTTVKNMKITTTNLKKIYLCNLTGNMYNKHVANIQRGSIKDN